MIFAKKIVDDIFLDYIISYIKKNIYIYKRYIEANYKNYSTI